MYAATERYAGAMGGGVRNRQGVGAIEVGPRTTHLASMPRISASIEVAVPAATCIHAVQQTMSDDRLLAAYRALRPGKEYAGFVTALIPDRRMVIQFAGLEPASNKRSHAVGWTVIYDFTPGREGTRVEISVEYGVMTAVMGAGLVRPQAENEIVHRLAALRMLEVGVCGVTASPE